MRPVFICQLSEEKQAEIRKMLEGLILHGCGGEKSEVERYYGMSFEEAVQNGMDSKIVDLDYLMVFYAEEYNSGKADEQFRLAATNHTTTSELVRQFVEKGLNIEGHKQDVDFIAGIIRQEFTSVYHIEDIKAVMKQQTNRLAKMLMKSGKLDGAGRSVAG